MIELSVVVLVEGEPDTPAAVTRIAEAVAGLGCSYEILCVSSAADGHGLPAGAVQVAAPARAGYGQALAAGVARARGTWVLTLDADILDVSAIVPALWARRHEAEVVIGSRYLDGGAVDMPAWRRLGSRLLNGLFGRGLSLGVRDMSSGVRLYRRGVLAAAGPLPAGLEALQTLLVTIYAEGWRVIEVPFAYRADPRGTSHARAQRFAADYLRTFWRLWKLRNSIECADYDARAHDSAIPLQRYWQRQRYRHVTELIDGHGPVLDVGCGSSRIIGALAAGQRRRRRAVAQAALRPPLRAAARPGVGVRAAVCRRELPVRPLLAGHRTRAEGLARSCRSSCASWRRAAASCSARRTTPTGNGW